MQHYRLDAHRLDEAMRRAGFETDLELAKAMGINSSQIGRWRKGRTTPGGDTLERLCNTLRCSPAFLFPSDDKVPELERILRELTVETQDEELVELIRRVLQLPRDRRQLLRVYLDTLHALK